MIIGSAFESFPSHLSVSFITDQLPIALYPFATICPNFAHFRPIDEFFHCLQSSFHKLFSVLDPFSTEFLQISLKIGPFLFILFNQMDEEIFLLRMSTMFGHNKDPPKEPGECRETALEFIGK